MRMEIVALERRGLPDVGRNQLAAVRGAGGGHPGRRGRGGVHRTSAPAATRSTACVDTDGEPVDRPPRGRRVRRRGAEPHPPDVAQHVRRRDAGTSSPSRAATICGTRRPRSSARCTSRASPTDCFNPVDLREWIRNAPEKKPMYTDPDRARPDRRALSWHAVPRPLRGPDRRRRSPTCWS